MSSPLVLVGLEDGVPYQLYVVASNGGSHGDHNHLQHSGPSATELAAPSAVPTAPGPPRSISVLAGHHTASVTWEAPIFDGGARVVSYEVACGSASSPSAFTASVSVTKVTLMGLVLGVDYQCTVSAFNAAGTGLPATVGDVQSVGGEDDHEH